MAAPEHTSRTWRQKLSMASVVTVVVATAIIAASSVIGYITMKAVYDSKVDDTWTIFYLEMERLSDSLRRHVSRSEALLDHVEGRVVYRRDTAHKAVLAEGAGPDTLVPKDLGAKAFPASNTLSLVSLQGRPYLYRLSPEYVFLYPVASTMLADLLITRFPDVSLYVLNKNGQLIFSDASTVVQESLGDRPLVQKFIRHPLRRGQVSYENEEGTEYFGFFQEVPQSNLILFAETESATIFAGIDRARYRFILLTIVVVMLTLLLLQWPLTKSLAPIQKLIVSAKKIGSGEFSAVPAVRSYGEVQVLGEVFQAVGHELAARDQRIATYVQEQEEKIRLQGELEVAQSIQANLLPRPLEAEGPVSVSSHYEPATEVAGDWFFYYENPSARETVVTVADVSGHGTGAAMFTATIATIFNDCRAVAGASFHAEHFMAKVNRTLLELGKAAWHASCVVLKVNWDTNECEVYNAGHPFPLLISSSLGKVKRVGKAGDLLGLSETCRIGHSNVVLTGGDKLLTFTDGLIENTDPSGNPYGSKRLRKICQANLDKPAETVVQAVKYDAQSYFAHQPEEDDVCIVGVGLS